MSLCGFLLFPQQTVNFSPLLFFSVSVCWCELFKETSWQWGDGRCREVCEGFIRVSLSPLCLFFSGLGWGARSHGAVLVPLQGSSLNFIYIHDANHTDTLTEQSLLQ